MQKRIFLCILSEKALMRLCVFFGTYHDNHIFHSIGLHVTTSSLVTRLTPQNANQNLRTIPMTHKTSGCGILGAPNPVLARVFFTLLLIPFVDLTLELRPRPGTLS
ncbi:hypothetical protein N7G274_000159 [Stereocaulon virgatum]|uniref:Secreted protein n=1 Tax=Stereocaulon virgatum TaxID=373712 RepID=A0ABR4AXQ7_9LECA